MAFDPNAPGTRFFINDVGQGACEEIDLGQSGADYGWNCREGAHTNITGGACSPTPAGMIDPIFEYHHGDSIPGTTAGNCGAITGGAFVPNGIWPRLRRQPICSATTTAAGSCADRRRPATSARTSRPSWATAARWPLLFGPHRGGQALYYTTYADGGQVRRIAYSRAAGNNAPEAVASANPLGRRGAADVTFSAAGSSDPDAGDTLTYFWNFGDGTPEASTTSLTLAHTYTSGGIYTATLRVRDNHVAFSPPATVRIAGRQHARRSPRSRVPGRERHASAWGR